MKRSRLVLVIIAVIIILVIIGPLIIPFPELEGIEPVDNLLYANSEFMDIDGVNIHYREVQNGQPLILLLHGFGSSTYSWENTLTPLSEFGTVLAYDRPAFGLTERVEHFEDMNQNPYSFDFQVSMVEKIMDKFGADSSILIGNSAGGAIAIAAALKYPEKIKALILVDSAVENGNGAPTWIRPILDTPQMDILGPLFVRSIRDRGLEILKLAWYDPSKISEDVLSNYQKPLKVQGWDKALWEYTKANENIGIENSISSIQAPVLIISGAEDKLIPKEQSIRLSKEIVNSELVLIPQCGHVPQEECPEEFLNAVSSFLSKVK